EQPPAERWAAPASCGPAVIEEDAEYHSWQPGCSLAIDEERAYVASVAGDGPRVVAYDLGDGSEVWTRTLAHPAGALGVVDGQVLVAGFGPGATTEALDPATGAPRWSVEATGYAVIHAEGTLLL